MPGMTDLGGGVHKGRSIPNANCPLMLTVPTACAYLINRDSRLISSTIVVDSL